jgi:hypothetical protein
MDGKLARGIFGRLSRPWVTWPSEKTILQDPMRLPWADLHKRDSKTETEEFNLVTYYTFQGDKEPSRTPR